MDTELSQENIKISLSIPERELYIIKSEDIDGSFEVERKFKDLVILKRNLSNHWPGCYIPFIPDSIANIEENDIRKLVENYIIKIISIAFLYRSAEFQYFLKDNREYSKIPIEVESTIEMSERYQKVFSHVTITDFDDEYITNSESNFESTLSKMQNFSTICRQNSSNYESYARELSMLFDNMNKVGKILIDQEEIIILREECINPYKIIQDWLTNEIYEVQGILNAIKSRERIGKIRAKAESQVNENQVAYDKVASGKKSLMQKLKGQSEEEIKNHLQEVLLGCKHEAEMIRITEKIINNRLAKLEIPFFKKTRSFHFNKIMKAFLSAHCDEFNSIITQSKRMLYIHNNK